MNDRGDPALRLRDARFAREGAAGVTVAVRELALAPGEAVAVVGPSGAGKSTLLEGILGVARPSASVRLVAGRCERGPHATWLPQDATAAFDPTARLAEQLRWAAPGAGRDRQIDALRGFGVDRPEALLQRLPSEVSGGELRRVLLALAVLRADPLLLIDEPTEGLDAPRIEQTCAQLGRLLRADHLPAALLVTHDPRVAARLADRVAALVGGELVDGGLPTPVDWAMESAGRAPRAADAPPGAALLEARGLCVRHGARVLCESLDLCLVEGETVALLGPSGVGKSSLARLLVGLDRPTAGQVVRRLPGSAVQLVPQDAIGSLTPHLPVGRQIVEVATVAAAAGFDLDAHRRALGLGRSLLQRPAGALSGGEARRVALLRTLASQPRVLLVDEPTAHLDAASARRVVALLTGRAGLVPPATQLWITHDDDLAAACADRVVRLEPDGGHAVLAPCATPSSLSSPSWP